MYKNCVIKHVYTEGPTLFPANLTFLCLIFIRQSVNGGLRPVWARDHVSMWVNVSVNVQVCWIALVRTCLPRIYGWLHSCLEVRVCLCSCDLYNSAYVCMSIYKSLAAMVNLKWHYENRRVLESALLWPILHSCLHQGWGWWQYWLPSWDPWGARHNLKLIFSKTMTRALDKKKIPSIV